MPFTAAEIQNLPEVISQARFSTYLNSKNGDRTEALKLYKWNLEVSSALIVPLQICEVSVRNAISEAIVMSYGQNWPFKDSFKISLTDPKKHYSPKQNLQNLQRENSAGKVIAELNFAFWQYMFTKRHDKSIWNQNFNAVFPNSDQNIRIQEKRLNAFNELKSIRSLRNRIAHHEPIISRNIQDEYDRIRRVISWRDEISALWVDKIETVTGMINQRP